MRAPLNGVLYKGAPLNGVLYKGAPLNGVLYEGAPLNGVLHRRLGEQRGACRAGRNLRLRPLDDRLAVPAAEDPAAARGREGQGDPRRWVRAAAPGRLLLRPVLVDVDILPAFVAPRHHRSQGADPGQEPYGS